MGMPTQSGSSSQPTNTPAGQPSAPVSSSQPTYMTPSSICDDTSTVRRVNRTKPIGIGRGRDKGIGRGRGMLLQTSFGAATGNGVNNTNRNGVGATFTGTRGGFSGQKRGRGNSNISGAQKRTRYVGFGLYTNHTTGHQILNLGTSSERLVLDGKSLNNIGAIDIDIGFKPRGLQWNGRNALTTSQLQNMAAVRRYSTAPVIFTITE